MQSMWSHVLFVHIDQAEIYGIQWTNGSITYIWLFQIFNCKPQQQDESQVMSAMKSIQEHWKHNLPF